MGLIADLVFPQKCFLCGKLDNYLCVSCLEKLPQAKYQICPECGLRALNGQTHSGCLTKTSLMGLYSPFAYQQGIKKLLKTYKFELVKELQEIITDLLVSSLKRQERLLSFLQKEKYTLIPLSLHPIKEKWRGFNQSFLISRNLSRELGLSHQPNLLKRTEFAPPQVGLSKEKRRANIKNQFQASLLTKRKNIVLLDDVWTTGSTLKEAAKELRIKGAKSVWALTLCRS